MIEVFGAVKQYVSVESVSKTRIRSPVFTASRLGMIFTLVACLLVTARTYIGDNIKCATKLSKHEHKAVETYCFIASTFTVLPSGDEERPHPGVGPTNDESEQVRHAYYQWVPMVLVLQAAAYYIPMFLWRQMGKDFFNSVLCGLDTIYVKDSEKEKRVNQSATYFVKSFNKHKGFAFRFLLCEVFAVAIAIGNIFFTDKFLGGAFLNYGPGVLSYLNTDVHDPDNPMNAVFPKVTKCTWRKFGATATIERHDALCVLPLNIVNEKTFVVLWVVYVAVAAVVSITFLWHLVLALLPSVRRTFLIARCHDQPTKSRLFQILPKCDYGGWFLMFHFQSNMSHFREWLTKVREEMDDEGISK
ncbi:innexin inx2-like [Oratosquilla oratoria]|uniref:innexin inx2-like n=1 Tax=Oratosquilla oratoria TaxID=337810 RepID=UPI003F772AE0